MPDLIYCRRKHLNIEKWTSFTVPEPSFSYSPTSSSDLIMTSLNLSDEDQFQNPMVSEDQIVEQSSLDSETLTLENETPQLSDLLDHPIGGKFEALEDQDEKPLVQVAIPDSEQDPVLEKRRAVPKRKRRGVTTQLQKSIAKKLETLGKNFMPVPFVPNKTLAVTTHEKLLRRLRLWDFVRVEFDRHIRADLVTQLIVNYNPQNRCSRVGDLRIHVSRADLARALKLPMKKDKISVAEADVEVEVASEESIAFVENLVSNWVLLHEDTWIIPDEVVNWTRVIKEGHPEKVDWASLIWFMVEKEVLQGPRLNQCYYASHLQCLIKSQRNALFIKVTKEQVVHNMVKVEEGGRSDVSVCEDSGDGSDLKLGVRSSDVKMEADDDVNVGMDNNDVNIGMVDDVNIGIKGNDVNIGVANDVIVSVKDNDVNVVMDDNEVNISVNDDAKEGMKDNDVNVVIDGNDVNISVNDDAKDGMNDDDMIIRVNDDASLGMKDIDDVNIGVDDDVNVGMNGSDVNSGVNDNTNVGMKGVDVNIGMDEDVNVGMKGNDANIGMDEDVNVGMKGNDVNVGVEDDVNIIGGDGDVSLNCNDANMGDDGNDMDIVVDCNYGGHEVQEPNIGLSLGLDSFEHEQLVQDEIMDFAECREEDHESGQWHLNGKNNHFLQPCNNQNIAFDCDDQDEKEDQLIEHEEQHVGFTLLPKGNNSIETSFIQEIEASQVPCSSRMQLRNHTLNEQHFTSSDQANLVSGGPSIFGKREADHEEIRHKKLRSENEPWSQQPLSDFDVWMENVQHYLGKAKRLYKEKEQISASFSANQEVMMGEIQQRDEMIEQLQKLRYDEQQKHRMDIYKLERELFGMNDLLKGYRKLLNDNRRSFAEYRKQANLPEEPLYKDVPGSGGLMLSANDLAKYRLKQKEEERIKRVQMECMVTEFEKEWAEIFAEFRSRTVMLDSKLMDIEKEVKVVKDGCSRRKGSSSVAEVAGAASPPNE